MSLIYFLPQARYWFIFYMQCIKLFFTRTFSKNKKFIFILSTPRHGNLGDHAIVYSQYNFFESIGYKSRIIEFNETMYAVCKDAIQKIIYQDDIVIIDGGGNIGTLWPREENIIRDIITRFSQNPVFIMPETAYFENSDSGKEALKESIRIYSSHPDLTVFCRDEGTYKLFSEKFTKVKSFYVPDMVMFLSGLCQQKSRDGALICFREDLEGVFSQTAKDIINKKIESKKIRITYSSTLIDARINNPKKRIYHLSKKWEEFSNAEFVITDRLHGMIFCAITGTPCLAVDNISHKVRDGYQWLEHLPYILYCDNGDDAINKVNQLFEISSQNFIYDSSHFKKYYNLMKNQIKNSQKKI